MKITPLKTRKFLPPKDDLWELLGQSIPNLKEKAIVAVTSKVVSIGEGRSIPIGSGVQKDELIVREADKYLPRDLVPGKFIMPTIKNDLFIPSAGIDESNALGHYILWPKDPTKSAKKIWDFLRKKFKVKNLGVIITDSHTIPMRRGLIGAALSYYGFIPLRDYRGKKDIFGRTLTISLTDIPDSLATAAVFVMGEGSEQTPIALIEDAPAIQFSEKSYRPKDPNSRFEIPLKEDLYRPFLESVPWKKGKGGV